MSISYTKYLDYAYVSAVELDLRKPEQNSPGTSTTIALSEYRSNIVSLLSIFETYERPDRKLGFNWLKQIKLGF